MEGGANAMESAPPRPPVVNFVPLQMARSGAQKSINNTAPAPVMKEFLIRMDTLAQGEGCFLSLISGIFMLGH